MKIIKLLIFVLPLVFLSCDKCNDNSFAKEGALVIYKANTNKKIAAFDIEIADDPHERSKGLMHRECMQDSRGMFFIYSDSNYRSFWMKNTLIPLDIIYINENFKIVSIQKNAEPMSGKSLPSLKKAKYVLEINAGLAIKKSILIGSIIKFKRI